MRKELLITVSLVESTQIGLVVEQLNHDLKFMWIFGERINNALVKRSKSVIF
jgi:hypothetical protein